MSTNVNGTAEIKTYLKDSVIFKQGHYVNGFYIVSKGKVICLQNQSSRLVPTFVASREDMIGECAIFGNFDSYDYSAIALEDTELILIEKKDIDLFLSKKKEWIKLLFQSLSEKIQSTSQLIADHRIIDKRLSMIDEFENDENKFREILKNFN